MNFGECPYDDCDAMLMFEVPDQSPKFGMVQCHQCRRKLWYLFSRLDPQAWTLDEFEKNFVVDEATKTVKRRAIKEKYRE